MFEMEHLRSFMVCAETLNFSEAGKRLGRVQSAVSTQVARLEEVSGQILFDRGRGRAMALTPSGAQLLIHAERLLRLNAEALQAMRPETPGVKVRFGTTETYAAAVLPRILMFFTNLHPAASVEVVCMRSPELLSALDEGDLDLVLVTDQGRRDGRVLSRENPLVWVAGPRFDTARDGPLQVAFMPEGCEFRLAGLFALQRGGREWHMSMTSPSPTGIRAALHAGIAATVMPTASVDPSLRVLGESDGLPSPGTVTVVAHRSVLAKGMALEAFIEQLRVSL